MNGQNLLSGLVRGFADGQKESRDRLEKEELKKLQIKLFKHDLDQKERADAGRQSLMDLLAPVTKTQMEYTGEDDMQAPATRTFPGMTLQQALQSPQGQSAALNAGYKLDDIRQFQQPSILDLLAKFQVGNALGPTGSEGLQLSSIKFDTKGQPLIDFERPKRLDLEDKAAVERQSKELEKSTKAGDMASLIQQADTLLNSASGGLANQALNVGKRVAGISDETTRTNERLKLISGWLVANVPRMEGPQSEFDVKNYQEMAGKVGDISVPVEDRRAALQELLNLQKKYNKNVPSLNLNKKEKPSAPVRIKGDADYRNLPSGARFIGPDGKERVKP